MKTPILFLIFKRPDTTKRVFEAIRKAKPEKLFIAADGPRVWKKGEKEKCEEVRKIVENINWKCKVKRLYRNENLGCEKAISGAINWFFEQVDEGIILEDDCLPNQSFFTFCSKMLKKYQKDERVMHIAGSSFLSKNLESNDSYYLSKYIDIWGWATWKRAWKYYDQSMKDWPQIRDKNELGYLFESIWEKFYWQIVFNATFDEKINTWGYKWLYSVWRRGGKCAVPAINLIENIGFGTTSTHVNTNKKRLIVKASNMKSNLKLLDNSFSKKAEHYKSKKIIRISPFMDLAQLFYYGFSINKLIRF